MTEIEEVKAQIQLLQKKLDFLEQLEKTKSPVEEAYKNAYGFYPQGRANGVWTISDEDYWNGFQNGYTAAAQEDYKVGEYQEPTKDKVSLYKRFENEGAYGQLYYDDALKVVRGFLMDEGVIKCEDEEYITLKLQKSLLEVPND